MKERITKNGIDYVLVGDYYIPDLKLPEEERPIGKYGRMHREYLREKDCFTIESVKDKIVIGGNNANSMAMGLNHY